MNSFQNAIVIPVPFNQNHGIGLIPPSPQNLSHLQLGKMLFSSHNIQRLALLSWFANGVWKVTGYHFAYFLQLLLHISLTTPSLIKY